MTFEQAITDIKQHPLTDFVDLTRSQGASMYCCPICGSGTGPKKTGALKVDTRTNRVMCFARGCFGDHGEDTPGALAKIWKCTLREALTRAGYQLDQAQSAPPPAPRPKKEPQPAPKREDRTAQYKEWNTILLQDAAALDTVHSWGITDEAIKHFLIGYAPEWAHSKTPNTKSKRVIFPRSRDTYSARVYDRSFTGEKKYQIEGAQHTLFNSADIRNTESKMPIIVVEGEIDAIVIWQLGFTGVGVVGLGSTTNKGDFITAAKEINPAAVYILALDNDPDGSTKDGQKTQEYIADELDKANIAYISTDTAALYGGMKDAGEAVTKDVNGFITRLMPYLSQGFDMRQEREKAAEIEAYNHSGPGMVDLFLQDVQTPRYKPISSGIKTLDRATGGGFINESVVMLGAAPGMGKTALISQVCENIAAAGAADVLYINLEMSREVLLARSIARIANERGGTVTVNEILRGYKWDAGTREVIAMAADEYKASIAGHLIYNPGKPETDLDKIMEKIENERRRIGHAPIVCLDYLQLLTGRKDEDTIDVIKRAMQTFKQYANDNHTIVFIVTANNRDSMKTGESGLNSGRDSSNIEYGADLHMGLEYASVGTNVTDIDENGEPKIEKGKDLSFIGAVKKAYLQMLRRNEGTPPENWNEQDKLLQDAYRKYCTRYLVRVNKNRYGDGEATAHLIFDGATARFVEIDTIHTEPQRKQPLSASQLPF